MMARAAVVSAQSERKPASNFSQPSHELGRRRRTRVSSLDARRTLKTTPAGAWGSHGVGRDGALPIDFPRNGCTEHADAPACEDRPDGGTGCAVQVPCHEASQEECPDDQAPDDPHGVGWPIRYWPAPRGWPGTHLVQEDPHGSASILILKARSWPCAHGLIRRRVPCRGGVGHHPRRPFAAVLSLGARIGMSPVACGADYPTIYKNDITLIEVHKGPAGQVRPCPRDGLALCPLAHDRDLHARVRHEGQPWWARGITDSCSGVLTLVRVRLTVSGVP